jgi:hypothetical protein
MRRTQLMGAMRQGLVVLGAVFVGAMPSVGEATADGPVVVKSRLDEVCLDAPTAGFIPVVINPCNGTDFQRWNIRGDARFENVAFPGNCLGKSDDSWNLRLSPCWTSRHWYIQPDGRITTDFGACLTVLGGPAPGTQVGTRPCNGAPEQGWDIVG